MKVFTLLSADGTDEFQAKLNEWLSEHKEDEIISVSHSSTELTQPVGNGTSIKGYAFSALILHNTKEVKEREVSFGWDKNI